MGGEGDADLLDVPHAGPDARPAQLHADAEMAVADAARHIVGLHLGGAAARNARPVVHRDRIAHRSPEAPRPRELLGLEAIIRAAGHAVAVVALYATVPVDRGHVVVANDRLGGTVDRALLDTAPALLLDDSHGFPPVHCGVNAPRTGGSPILPQRKTRHGPIL